jgi:hypothetical protein
MSDRAAKQAGSLLLARESTSERRAGSANKSGSGRRETFAAASVRGRARSWAIPQAGFDACAAGSGRSLCRHCDGAV